VQDVRQALETRLKEIDDYRNAGNQEREKLRRRLAELEVELEGIAQNNERVKCALDALDGKFSTSSVSTHIGSVGLKAAPRAEKPAGEPTPVQVTLPEGAALAMAAINDSIRGRVSSPHVTPNRTPTDVVMAKRAKHIREVCVDSIAKRGRNDRLRPDWLAETVINILNGAVDHQL
jgi:hypothetical protein